MKTSLFFKSAEKYKCLLIGEFSFLFVARCNESILLINITIYITKNIEKKNYLSVLYFFLPTTFIIDFLYIFFNVSQKGFSYYYNVLRFEYLSGYFLFSLLFIFIFFKLRSKIL